MNWNPCLQSLKKVGNADLSGVFLREHRRIVLNLGQHVNDDVQQFLGALIRHLSDPYEVPLR